MSAKTEKLLVIDDNIGLLRLMQGAFESDGFTVFTAQNGPEGLEKFHRVAPDLVILDIMMPHMDGWEVCQRIRKVSAVPIICLTALSSVADTVRGLEHGADDYLSKPFKVDELQARVKAQLRRARMSHERPEILRFGDNELVINQSEQRVFVLGEEIELSPTEYNLLVFLAESAGRILTPETIYHAIWGDWCETKPDRVRWHIWHLRQKIEPNAEEQRFILTERGKGYRFALN